MALLLAALQFVDEPGYSALILRRTYKQLAKADSILNKALEWLRGRARYNGDEHKFTFPSGATLEFGHMENEANRFDYQGGAWAFIGVDEATQFTETMLSYPRTRQRRPTGSRLPIRWRGASNPGGIGHDYVKARYVKDPHGNNPATPDRQFFPATLEDNPHIDREDYVRQLRDSGIDALTLAQLLAGDWDAVPGGRFRPEWFARRWRPWGDYLDLGCDGKNMVLLKDCLRFGTCDPAASATNASDHTVLCAWALTPRLELVWLDMVRGQWEIPDQVPHLLKLYEKWNLAYLAVEACASNRGVYQLARRTRMAVKEVTPDGKDKLTRATKAIVICEDGRVYLPVGPSWVDVALAELTRFTGDAKLDASDDIVDNLSYAARLITAPEDAKMYGFKPAIVGGNR